MYVDNGWRPSPEPMPEKPRLTERQERVFAWLIGINVLLIFVAPIGGATVLQPLLSWLRHG